MVFAVRTTALSTVALLRKAPLLFADAYALKFGAAEGLLMCTGGLPATVEKHLSLRAKSKQSSIYQSVLERFSN